MTFAEHLDELRSRLVKGAIVIVVLFFGGWTFLKDQLTALFMYPHQRSVARLLDREPPIEVNEKLILLSPLENLFFTLKASLMVACLIGLPFLVYQMWAFVSAGLHEQEKKSIRRFMPWSLLLSISGVAFCYMVFFPFVLEFLYSTPNEEFFDGEYRLKDYFGLYIMFTLALAMIFQLPVVLTGLGAAGLVDAAFLRKYRRHFILIAFIFGAMLTPPEPYSQFMMALPTVLLYELGVILVALTGKKRKQAAEASEATENHG